MILFYRLKFCHKIAKVFASKLFDIVWLRLATKSGVSFICYFYAPGAHHEETLRVKFYNTLCRSFEKFRNLGQVFMLCDSNARLGEFINDRNIHGVPTRYNNYNIFTEVLRINMVK